MITFMDPKNNKVEVEKCLDSQLWHACAGGMVQMPPVNSKVYYFPQGHAEHASAAVDFSSCPRMPPPLMPCRVVAVKFMADPDTDEVYAKMRLLPIPRAAAAAATTADDGDSHDRVAQEKPASFAKTLTQSDANNGGGFSVPRYCAETIFPRLDYAADPPVQTILAKDVHGETWKFRHIYRGTPRRHLLTTGWSNFVNHKKLVAGDSIVFLRTETGDLCIGIRRVKRGIGGGPEPSSSGWNPAGGNFAVPYGGFHGFLREGDNRLDHGSSTSRDRVRAESVVEASSLAAAGKAFEVVYFPRASTPEFCVKAAAVRAAMQVRWCSGMRFKMAFETEDSSRISWFMGTISSVQVADPIRWPDSPWRLLQVTWDEPDLLQNVRCISPWLVELVSNIPMNMNHLPPFSPPTKKPRLSQYQDFPLDGHLPLPAFSGYPLLGHSNHHPFRCLSENSTPAGMQGARHAQYSRPLSDHYLNKLPPLITTGYQPMDSAAPPPTRATSTPISGKPPSNENENVSCVLTIGNFIQSSKKSDDVKTPQFLLFGQPILTEKQISLGSVNDLTVSPLLNQKPSSEGDLDKMEGCSSDDRRRSRFQRCQENRQDTEFKMDTGHCKVFMESEEVGRSLDLSMLGSYEELCRRLANMFGMERSEMLNNVLYRDVTGSVKHVGDEPFSNFLKTARRLMILTDSNSDNVGL